MRTLQILVTVLLATPVAAQVHRFDPADLPGRQRAAQALEQLLDDETDVNTLVALAATAGVDLAPGSAARVRLTDALRAANVASDPAKAGDALRLELGSLVETLRFRPVAEAELPVGFPGFTVVDEVELREYPAYRMVRTGMRGGANGAFWPLFRHIESNGIAMTTPVQTDWSEQAAKPATMAFLYGDPAKQPEHTADDVEVVDTPAMTVLSIGSIGSDRKARVEALQQRLLDFVAASAGALEVAGPLRTMGYNSPMVRTDRRYFEVQLPVRCVAVER